MRARPAPDLRPILANPDLSAAFSDHGYVEVARRCEDPYRHWNKARFLAREAGLDPEILWAVVKLGRLPRYRELPLQDTAGRPLRIIEASA